MSNCRPKFSKNDFNTVLRELCCEARQTIWKTFPEREFEINGKTCKKKASAIKKSKTNKVASNQGSVDNSANSSEIYTQQNNFADNNIGINLTNLEMLNLTNLSTLLENNDLSTTITHNYRYISQSNDILNDEENTNDYPNI